MTQLMLFEIERKPRDLTQEFDDLKIMVDKVRKGQFAKISDVKKECSELRHELEILKIAMLNVK